MKKIPTLFKRDFSNNGMIIPEYNETAQWVVNGEGIATRKYDGTSVLIRDGHMYKRYEYKDGKTPPTDFEEADYDTTTGKHVGWVAVGWGSEDKWFREALPSGDPDNVPPSFPDGTYELLGPKVQGNPEKYEKHVLFAHSLADEYADVPTEFEEWIKHHKLEPTAFGGYRVGKYTVLDTITAVIEGKVSSLSSNQKEETE